jgi:YggT family protein
VGFVCALILVYMVVLVGRAVMSWFPVRPGTPAASIYSVLLDLTEPVLAPLRRIIPPAGMFDLSFLVLFIGLSVLQQAIC